MAVSHVVLLLSAAVLISTRDLRSPSKRGFFDLFDCKEEYDACWGTIPCCGELQCYFEKGVNIINSGYCVKCVAENLICQRDEQCCEGLMCERSHHLDAQGSCKALKRTGEDCYRDEQCRSGACVGDEGISKYYGHCAP